MKKFVSLNRRFLLTSYRWIFGAIFLLLIVLSLIKCFKRQIEGSTHSTVGHILFDENCLKLLEQTHATECNIPVIIATDREDQLEQNPLFARIKLLKISKDISTYYLTDTGGLKRAFFKFETKIIPLAKVFGHDHVGHSSFDLKIPANIMSFLDSYRNSHFLECRPTLDRKLAWYSKRVIPIHFSARIAEFLEILSFFSITGFLFNGSLLGWRRECSIIPHTTDVDIAMFANQHSDALLSFLKKNTEFRIIHTLGRPEDSFELSVAVDNIKIDLFYLYDIPGSDNSYTSSMIIPRRQQLKAIYPKVKGICKGDLHGHLVSLPCNVEELLQADYGSWRVDMPTSKYIWYKTPQNLVNGTVFTEEEFKLLYQPFFDCC